MVTKVTKPNIIGKVTTGAGAADLIHEIKDKVNALVDAQTQATLTDKQIEEAVSRSVNGTGWKGPNGDAPLAAMTADVVTGDVPFTVTFTDNSAEGDNPIVSREISFSNGNPSIDITDGALAQLTMTEINDAVTATLTVSDQYKSDTFDIVITSSSVKANVPPSISNKNFVVEQNVDLKLPLGPLKDSDNDDLTYVVVGHTGNTTVVAGSGANERIFNSSDIGTQTLTVQVSDGRGGTDTATFSIDVVAAGSLTYPIITKPEQKFVATNGTLNFTPTLSNAASAGIVLWSKDFGHDDIKVNPATGEITWDTTGLSSESFHVGLRCSNANGHSCEHFIVHVGKTPDQILTVGPNETYNDWYDVHPIVKAGDTVIFKDGTYNGGRNRIGRDNGAGLDRYPISGTSARSTDIMAENPTGAKFSDGTSGVAFNLWSGGKNEASYITFKGFYFSGGSTLAINGDPNDKVNTRPHHMKIINNVGEGVDDIPLYCRLCDDMLFENNFAYGGGRYKISANECKRVIMRRNVVRYDRSDRKVSNDPKGSHIMYNCVDFRMQNLIAIDDLDKFVNTGYKAGAFGTPVTSTSVTPEGSFGTATKLLQLNSEQLVHQYDYQVNSGGGASYVTNTDNISYDMRPHGIFLYSWGFSLFRRCLWDKVRPLHTDGNTSAVHTGGYNNCRGFDGCFFNDFIPQEYNNFLVGNLTTGFVDVPYNGGVYENVEKIGFRDNNLSGGTETITTLYAGAQTESGTTNTTIDAHFKYVPRGLENTYTGSQTSPTIMTFTGKSGTYFNEENFEVETELPCWPFPFSSQVHQTMKDYSVVLDTYSGSDYLNRVKGADETLSGNRGFCADGQDLTSYIWGYKGNQPPPQGVTATSNVGGGRIFWELPSSAYTAAITGYKIYTYDPDTGTLTNPVTKDATRLYHDVTGLNDGFEYQYVVTATTASGESGFSYPAVIIPNGTPTIKPIISSHPENQSVIAGDQVTLTADVQGATLGVVWTRNDVEIPTATNETYVFTATDADNNAVYKIKGSNAAGDTFSNGATLSVTALDSTAPTATVSLSGDILSLTINDNLYNKADLVCQLYAKSVSTGATFAGTTTSLDLTTYGLVNGDNDIYITVKDPQNNVGTSNTVTYSVGSPVFSDNFDDATNWNGAMTINNGVATVNATTLRGKNDWWSAADKMSVKFTMKITDQANIYEAYPRIDIGCTTTGTNQGTIRIFAYPSTASNGWMTYVDRAGTEHQLGSFSGFGNNGSYDWHEYEVIAVGTQVTFKKGDTVLLTGTIPESIQPFSGTMEITQLSDGDLQLDSISAF